MEPKPIQGVIISDFNADNLAAYLNNSDDLPAVTVQTAPFGQVVPLLVDAQHAIWQNQPDFAIIWTQPQAVSGCFAQALAYEPVVIDTLLAEVDAYADMILNVAGRAHTVFVPAWVIASYERSANLLDFKDEYGVAAALMQMNLRLAQRLNAASNVYMLDATRWVTTAGSGAFTPKLWYMAKVAFGNAVFKEAARDIKAALAGIRGLARKLIVVDLDDTLWDGVVGDVGWENLRLGGHDAVGEAFVHFQKALKSLTKRGILLAIASKNTESVALEAINSHPEMVLKPDDFVAWRINWQDKAQNIAEMVSELNLGLQSVVFIDDNPVERARVREALPEVLVPEWPADKLMYRQALMNLRCFDAPALSAEDQQRTQMYITERKRSAALQNLKDIDTWLESLDLRVQIESLDDSNLVRTAQLLNKTNQMNLSTRRLSESELTQWAQTEGHQVWAFRVSDKFGDQGLTGILSVALEGSQARIVDYVLSCRVMGRKVEETMVATAIRHAQNAGAQEVIAEYLPTAKNQPCLDFWQRSGFDYDESTRMFRWDVAKPYPYPDAITVMQN